VPVLQWCSAQTPAVVIPWRPHLVVGNLEEDELPGSERIQQSKRDRRDHGAEEASSLGISGVGHKT
jgi:hypothetical protein